MTATLRHRSDLTGSEVWEGDARAVAGQMPSDSCTLAIFDGPYAMQKAAWDRLKVTDLPEWYRPFLEDAGRVLAPSASLYFWNTAEGWAAVHPVILSMGWTFRALVVWDKTVAHMAETQATIRRVGGRCRVEVVPVPDEVPDTVPAGDPVEVVAPGQLSLFGGGA